MAAARLQFYVSEVNCRITPVVVLGVDIELEGKDMLAVNVPTRNPTTGKVKWDTVIKVKRDCVFPNAELAFKKLMEFLA